MTLFRVGYENNNDARTIAWSLEHPGCFAYGADQAAAEAQFMTQAGRYVAWVTAHGGSWFQAGTDVRLTTDEVYDVFCIDLSYERVEQPRGFMVESFFLYDWKPLTGSDIERALLLLEWTRADLLSLVGDLTPSQLSLKPAGERWDIAGILNHVGAGEWFYQERLGHPFPIHEQDLPADPFERLRLVREHFIDLLPKLEGVQQVVGVEGEFWSPRKMLRRAVWHERDHTDHIRKLI